MDPLEDKTPTVEQKIFANTSSSSSSSSGSSSCGGQDDLEDNEDEKSPRMDLPVSKAVPASTSDDLSASYHEIFDTQMMPPNPHPENDAAAIVQRDEESSSSNNLPPPLSQSPQIPNCDHNTEATTQYLTSKLVQDSLRWQQTEKQHHHHGTPQSSSPSESPSRGGARRKTEQQQLAEEFRLKTSLTPTTTPAGTPAASASGGSGTTPVDAASRTTLDPALLLDIENDARYLATSVDNLVENLSGTLQSISALTVETVDTYKDGVCKTCDEVDNNIRAMYQLMAKVEELNKSMGPAYKMGEQIKDIKRLLEMLENSANSK